MYLHFEINRRSVHSLIVFLFKQNYHVLSLELCTSCKTYFKCTKNSIINDYIFKYHYFFMTEICS